MGGTWVFALAVCARQGRRTVGMGATTDQAQTTVAYVSLAKDSNVSKIVFEKPI